jgi:hypothetical protein
VRVGDIHILGTIIAEAVATEMTLRSLRSVSFIPTKEKGADSQMHRTRPPYAFKATFGKE